jgi:hypothetical protein
MSTSPRRVRRVEIENDATIDTASYSVWHGSIATYDSLTFEVLILRATLVWDGIIAIYGLSLLWTCSYPIRLRRSKTLPPIDPMSKRNRTPRRSRHDQHSCASLTRRRETS